MIKEDSLVRFLCKHKAQKPISFHMPGHKNRNTLYVKYGYGDFLSNIIGNDITEIPGADALQQPKTVIKDIMDNYANLYETKHTNLLVNGSSAGIMAAVLTCVGRGEELIMGKNSHASVFNALRLGGIEPVYVQPKIDKKYNLQAEIPLEEVEHKLKENPNAAAVIITSPNYYGIVSNIKSIARTVHVYNKILIVDQAHGAHLKFFDELSNKNTAAENCGADIVIESTHKTLLSFTESAIMHVCSERIDIEELENKLAMLQTTSPSYLLMGSLDINERIMRKDGYELTEKWKENLSYFYTACRDISGLTVIDSRNLDCTKININMVELGLSGVQLEKELMYNNIYPEMVHGEYVMLMTGIGNETHDYELLLKALKDISRKYGISSYRKRIPEKIFDAKLVQTDVPVDKERIPLYKAEGRVMYGTLTPFPPGVPIACPGEVLDYEVISYIQKLIIAGEKVVGVDEEGEVLVGKVNE